MSWMMCGDSVTERVSNDHLLDGQKSQNHMIDDTDSDQSVIGEWDPTILLETPYNIIMW
jgi:hypothetical protein